MTRLQFEDLVKRAGWASLWAFLSSFALLAPGILVAPNLEAARALLVAAMAAGIGAAGSALKTFILVSRH